MPVVSGAIAAVGAAIATTTVATVASAVAAVGTVVGMAGLATTAVGMITKDKGLMKAGKIMGFVGLGAGLAGWGVGALNSAGVFGTAADAADDIASASMSSVDDVMGVGATAKDGMGNTMTVGADGGIHHATEGVPSLSVPVDKLPQGALEPLKAAERYHAAGLINDAPNYIEQVGKTDIAMKPFTQTSAMSAPAQSAPLQTPALQAPTLPGVGASAPTPPAGLINAPGGLPAGAGVTTNPAGLAGLSGAGATAPPAGGVAGWWNGLSDTMKASLATTAGQGIAGALGGIFQAMSASDRYDLEREMEAWKQRNGSYAPRVSFGRS